MQNNRSVFFKYLRDNNLKFYNRKIKTPAYLDLNTFFPEHKILEENWKEIKGEIEGIISSDRVVPKFHEIDNGQEYISDNDGISWNLFNIKVYDMWHLKNKSLCPKTVKLLEPMKNVKGFYFSILAPGKHIPPHKGPYKGIIRYQLALSVPKNGECKILVDGKPHYWTEGKSVLFDDTYTHEVLNNSQEKRIALLLDIKRNIPGFFMRQYDKLIFKTIQILLILNNTFSKSSLK